MSAVKKNLMFWFQLHEQWDIQELTLVATTGAMCHISFFCYFHERKTLLFGGLWLYLHQGIVRLPANFLLTVFSSLEKPLLHRDCNCPLSSHPDWFPLLDHASPVKAHFVHGYVILDTFPAAVWRKLSEGALADRVWWPYDTRMAHNRRMFTSAHKVTGGFYPSPGRDKGRATHWLACDLSQAQPEVN